MFKKGYLMFGILWTKERTKLEKLFAEVGRKRGTEPKPNGKSTKIPRFQAMLIPLEEQCALNINPRIQKKLHTIPTNPRKFYEFENSACESSFVENKLIQP